MAYANLVGLICASKQELFCRMRDFVCKRNGTYDYSSTGIGWTLIDSSYAVDEDNPQLNDWFVVASAGEGGKDHMRCKIVWSYNNIGLSFSLAWDSVSHTSSTSIGYSNASQVNETEEDKLLFIYGDLDFITILSPIIASSYTDMRGMLFGKLNYPYARIGGDIAVSSAPVLSGSDVSITVDTVPDSWEVGREIFIWTNTDIPADVKLEKTTIKTLSGSVITCDLINAYVAGFSLSTSMGYYAQTSSSFLSCSALIDMNGGVSAGASYVGYNTSFMSSIMSPGSYEDRWGLTPVTVAATTGVLGTIPNTYILNTGQLSLLDVLEDVDGNIYRYIKVYSNRYLAFLEV